MTDKEKLIELIESAESAVYWDSTDKGFIQKIADHLLANGVTIQNWIPVSERLPEIGGIYLVAVKYKYEFEKEYNYDTDVATYHFGFDCTYIDGCWNTYVDWDEGQQYLHVTHWMPIPEAPKEEVK